MCIANRFEECLKEEEHKHEECTPEQIRECHGDVAVRRTSLHKRGGEK